MSNLFQLILDLLQRIFFTDIKKPVVPPIAPTPPAPPMNQVSPTPPPPAPSKLLNAIIEVESGGDDYAEGDKTLANHAYGALQIRQGVCDQVNAKFGTKYRSQDCLGHREVSVDIWNKYWEVFTFLVTDEDKAKAWNGGPYWKKIYHATGYERYSEAIDAYWAKVQKYL
jgi:hypothetical protein